MRRWWVNKYKLPPNHELYLDRTEGDLVEELYEDLREQFETKKRELTEHKGSEEEFNQYNHLAKLLDEEVFVPDPLVDKWERELEMGKTPDLTERLP